MVNTDNFGDKMTDQLKGRYRAIGKATRKRSDTGVLSLLDVDPAKLRVEFSFDEDSSIMDIANNPSYSNYVPDSV